MLIIWGVVCLACGGVLGWTARAMWDAIDGGRP